MYLISLMSVQQDVNVPSMLRSRDFLPSRFSSKILHVFLISFIHAEFSRKYYL
jgi:hypothetical protein